MRSVLAPVTVMVSLALRIPLTTKPVVVSPSPSTAMANTIVGVLWRKIQLLSAQLCSCTRLGSKQNSPFVLEALGFKARCYCWIHTVELSLNCMQAVVEHGLFS
jgi:hypothetical protein